MLKVWDLTDEKRQDAAFVGHCPWLGHACFVGDKPTVATTGLDDAIRLWDARTGRQTKVIEHHMTQALAGSQDGKLVAASSQRIDGSSLGIWDAASGKMLRENSGVGRNGYPKELCFTAGGKRLAGMCEDGRARLWSVETGALISESSFQIGKDMEKDSPFGSHEHVDAEFSPDGRSLAAALRGVFHLYQVDRFKKVRQFGTDSSPIGSHMAFSADSKLLLTSSFYPRAEDKKPDGTLKTWVRADRYAATLAACRRQGIVAPSPAGLCPGAHRHFRRREAIRRAYSRCLERDSHMRRDNAEGPPHRKGRWRAAMSAILGRRELVRGRRERRNCRHVGHCRNLGSQGMKGNV